jgi:hypothetical protein
MEEDLKDYIDQDFTKLAAKEVSALRKEMKTGIDCFRKDRRLDS